MKREGKKEKKWGGEVPKVIYVWVSIICPHSFSVGGEEDWTGSVQCGVQGKESGGRTDSGLEEDSGNVVWDQ